MVQKSILSFFGSPKPKKPEGGATGGQSKPKKEKEGKEEEEKSVNSEAEESPIKKKSTRRKSRVIESDSEEEEEDDAPNQPSTSSSPNKSDEEKENKVKKKLARFSIDNDRNKDDEPKKANKDKEPKSKGKTPTKTEKGTKEKTNKKLKKDDDEKKGSDEEMEAEEGKDEGGTKKEGKDEGGTKKEGKDDSKVKGKKDDSEGKDSDEGTSIDVKEAPSTPKRSSPSSSQLPTGFTPTTVPPLRKTARKQMKRKSDGMEEKQRAKIRKLKEENGSPSKDSDEKQSDSEGETEKNEKVEENRSPSKEGETEKKEIKENGSPSKEGETEKKEIKENGSPSKEGETEKKEIKENGSPSKEGETEKKEIKENGSPSKEGETEKKEIKENGSPSKDANEGKTKEKGSPVKDTKKKTNDREEETEKQEEDEDKDDDEDEPMEVDEKEEEKTDKKEETTTPSRPKPAAMHSFFAPKPKKSLSDSPKKEDKEGSSPTTHNSPIKTKLIEEEEENCSSPMKKMKPEKKGKNKPQKKVATPKMKKEKDDDDDNDTSPKTKKGTPKTKKEKGTPKAKKGDSKKKATTPKIKKEDDSESPKSKKDSPKIKKEETSPVKTKKEEEDEENMEKEEKEEEEKTEKKEEKVEKPKINPFAPKPKTGGAKDVGADYNPGKKKYHPIDDAFWTRSQKVPYLALAKTMELIENTSGRLRTIEILANFLRSVIVLSPEDLLYCIYLCLNKVAPAFEGVELGVGETILVRTIAQASGRSVDMVKGDAEKQGDLGIVAEQSRSSQRLMFQPANLTLKGVFDKLKEIALMTGNSSQNRKIDKIKGMYVACRYSEARYLIRSLGGKLRIGLAEQSVLQAIAQACFLTPPGQEYPPEVMNAGTGIAPDRLKAKIDNYGLILKTTYCEFPSYDKIVPVLLTEGLEELPKHCQLTPGIPLKPMLAHPTTGVSEVLRRFENAKFTCEFKYDGERAQIHMKEDGSISIYSRNQEDNTTKYPDIIARFKNALGEDVKSCVIDSEAVAWDREKKQILPFQILSTRKRKDADEKDIKVQVCVFPFDLLYFNGEPMVKKTFEERRAVLTDNFKEVEGEFVFAKSMDSTNTEDIEEFLEESIKGNCEGLMVKTLDVDATYEIAKRSHNWLKLKKDYLDGVGDTIDTVVMGGYMGKGKRAGHYGGFLLACYDAENEEYQTLCKIGTGFTDESLLKHSEFFKDHVIEKPKSYYRYENNIAPDHWFEPVQVWEIKCADLSISPVHKAAAGIVDPEKGISLRFPRFLRIREDKTPEDATSASQIADLYNSQDQIKNKKATKNDEEEFY